MIPDGELFQRDDVAAKPAHKAKHAKAVRHEPTDFDKFCWYEAPRMENVATCYIPRLTQQEIWEKSKDWIYDRFDRLGKAVLTGISTSDMQASLQRCEKKHNHLVLAWSWLRPGTRSYVSYVKHLGLAGVRESQQFFISGFDLGSRHWCGLCANDFVEARKQSTQEK